jgi:signal transduction histidine kinase
MNYGGEVLVVDDDEDLLDMVSFALSRAGYKVTSAPGGREAVALVKAGNFDLVVLDIMMPGMDGLTALTEIKKASPAVEVIMLTAHGSVDTAVESMRMGALDYLKKPFEIESLEAAVRKGVEKRKLSGIARAALGAVGREELADVIAEAAARLLSGDEAFLVLSESGTPFYLAASPGVGDAGKRKDRFDFCLRGLALLEAAGGDVLTLLPSADQRFAGSPCAGDLAAALFIPLTENGKTAGALCVTRLAGGAAFGEKELRTAKNFGPLAALAVKNSVLAEQLRDVRMHLAQTQKMEALGLLAGQISHDFNNLLTVIIGSIQLLMETQAPGAAAKLPKDILGMAREAEALVKQLLLFSRGDVAPAGPININAAIGEIKVIIDKLPGKGEPPVYDLDQAVPPVKIRPEHFKQIVLNLVINARKYTPAGGGVTVRTRRAAEGDPVPKALNIPACVILEVADSGQGISPETLNKIFEPFFSTSEKGKGTGLGLHIVHSLVREYGGGIAVESSPGRGASFRIFLPAA